ncbi:M20 family metallopeptidase [Hathewaya histolytica]|uniref:Metal-dependent amidase/aminoacylase/carboxypeptidase n=1 Tax=Hathewaya histolytica TaxID=1498 RepID=A0A4U9R1D3_HATHI|nr:M20 family metallopeptidase [Hathewaya histolytica]VTQ82470.1 metal-dependent amidase/aminoacylase/carboxypeptidase [Hathewaya histolytica]
MKQKTITYLSTIKEEIFSLSQFVYKNKELPFKEKKTCEYIINLLKKFNFKVEKNFLNINTSFFAQIGEGHPKVCYICKYSASKEGHIYGNNLNAAISIGCALAMQNIISEIGGSITVVGCPGDNFNGAELAIARENTFKDIDIIMCPHVYNETLESGTSCALIPFEITFKSRKTSEEGEISSSTLDACLLTFNILNSLIKNNNNLYSIDGLSINSLDGPYNLHPEASLRFYIRGNTLSNCECLESSIKDILKGLSNILNVDVYTHMFELPCRELLTNKSLSRVFSHNLKECGIIDIDCCRNIPYGLSIGSISHTTPCIYPSISICNSSEDNIQFPSKEFELLTLSDFAKSQCLKIIKSICLTSIDIIEREDLLREMTIEMYDNKKSK